MNELYEELYTPEGARKIYRIAKGKAFAKNNQIKDEQRVVLRVLGRIIGRWKGCFDKLLNGEHHMFVFEDGVPNDGLRIGRNEVRVHVITNEEGRDNGNGWDSSGCVWEKKGLPCYQSDATCIRAGEHTNGVERCDLSMYKEE